MANTAANFAAGLQAFGGLGRTINQSIQNTFDRKQRADLFRQQQMGVEERFARDLEIRRRGLDLQEAIGAESIREQQAINDLLERYLNRDDEAASSPGARPGDAGFPVPLGPPGVASPFPSPSPGMAAAQAIRDEMGSQLFAPLVPAISDLLNRSGGDVDVNPLLQRAAEAQVLNSIGAVAGGGRGASVFELAQQGLSEDEIAAALGVSVEDVQGELARLFQGEDF